MYVGVKLTEVRGRHQQVVLYYTEPDSQESYEAASFQVPSLVDSWTRFAIAVRGEEVTLYLNCDAEPQVKRFERSPDDMELEPGAGVFVGQAGGADPDKFLVGDTPSRPSGRLGVGVLETGSQEFAPEGHIYYSVLVNEDSVSQLMVPDPKVGHRVIE